MTFCGTNDSQSLSLTNRLPTVIFTLAFSYIIDWFSLHARRRMPNQSNIDILP